MNKGGQLANLYKVCCYGWFVASTVACYCCCSDNSSNNTSDSSKKAVNLELSSHGGSMISIALIGASACTLFLRVCAVCIHIK